MPIEFTQYPSPENTGVSGDTLFRLTVAYDGTGRRISKTRWVKAQGDAGWSRGHVTHYTGIGTEVHENFAGPAKETKVVVNMPVFFRVTLTRLKPRSYIEKDILRLSNGGAILPKQSFGASRQGLGRYGIEDADRMAEDGTAQTFEWFLKNHLGSTMLVYGTGGTSGGLKAAYDYRSFGEQIELTTPPTGKVTENFTGKELDDETQLDYFGARYLDPMLGMWISVDPKRQFASPYLYAGNGVNPVNAIDPDGNRVFGTYNRTTGEVYLVDENEKRGERSFFAISGYKNQKDDTKFGGPIPQGKYAIIEDPWKKRDDWFGLFYKDDERFDDYIQGGSSDGRGEFRFHRFINLSLGCVSAKTKTEEDYLKIYEWIKGTETQKVKDADGIWHIDYGEIEVISDDD